MLPFWKLDPFVSRLGGSIYPTEKARYNSAVAWYRTSLNLGYPKDILVRLARFIRHGVLNAREASEVLSGRLSSIKRKEWDYIEFMIEYWMDETDFYFHFVDFSDLWPKVSKKVVNTTLFP